MLTPFLTLILFFDLFPFYIIFYIILHTIAHAFYVITWNYGYYAKRIQNWTSFEYKGKQITYDFFLTLFDMSVYFILINYMIFELVKNQNCLVF